MSSTLNHRTLYQLLLSVKQHTRIITVALHSTRNPRVFTDNVVLLYLTCNQFNNKSTDRTEDNSGYPFESLTSMQNAFWNLICLSCFILSFKPPLRGLQSYLLITARVRTYDGRLCFHRCVSVQGAGSQVSDFWGGIPGLRFSGGVPGLRFLGGGVPSLSKGKIFWHQIWLDTCSDWEKKFLSRDPPPLSKGKNFWHQIWLHTCSDCEFFFLSRDPPPPPGIARNCYGYVAGGMPLAFTQEDFLVQC